MLLSFLPTSGSIRSVRTNLLRVVALLVMVGFITPVTIAQQTAKAPASKPHSAENEPNKFMRIQQVKSPGGIDAWLVESHHAPLLALRFAFSGGDVQDPAGLGGVANFITAMMDEGAGKLDSATFQERMEEIAMRMDFDDSRDFLYGSMSTLTVNRDKAVELLRLAVTKPRFDADAVDRIKKQLLASLAFSARDPNRVAHNTWRKLAYGDHPYGRPSSGTPESVAKISSQDLHDYHRRVFARDTLKVVAVGDIDAATLGPMLDQIFGDLPETSQVTTVPAAEAKAGQAIKVVDMAVPQSVAHFGSSAMVRQDPDFIPAYVVNQILGGGGFASRLMEEVREKRGLAYSVYTYLYPMRRSSMFGGGVATVNAQMSTSLEVIRSELERMATKGPTQTELDNAKSYLIGSYALRFDTNAKIASQLLGILVQDLGIDYIDKRNAMVEAVTLEDAKRAAARLLRVNDLIVAVVGRPDGLTSSASTQ